MFEGVCVCVFVSVSVCVEGGGGGEEEGISLYSRCILLFAP